MILCVLVTFFSLPALATSEWASGVLGGWSWFRFPWGHLAWFWYAVMPHQNLCPYGCAPRLLAAWRCRSPRFLSVMLKDNSSEHVCSRFQFWTPVSKNGFTPHRHVLWTSSPDEVHETTSSSVGTQGGKCCCKEHRKEHVALRTKLSLPVYPHPYLHWKNLGKS